MLIFKWMQYFTMGTCRCQFPHSTIPVLIKHFLSMYKADPTNAFLRQIISMCARVHFCVEGCDKIILGKNVTLYGHEPHDVTSSYLCLVVKAFIEIMMGVSFLWIPPFIDSRIFALVKSGDIA